MVVALCLAVSACGSGSGYGRTSANGGDATSWAPNGGAGSIHAGGGSAGIPNQGVLADSGGEAPTGGELPFSAGGVAGVVAPRPICEAGRQVACPCIGGEQGVQICRDDGSGWETCVCPHNQDSGGRGGESGEADPGSGGSVRLDGGASGGPLAEEGGSAGAAGSPAPGGTAPSTGGTNTGGSGCFSASVPLTGCPAPGLCGGCLVDGGFRCGTVTVDGCPGSSQCGACPVGYFCGADSWCVAWDAWCSSGIGRFAVVPVPLDYGSFRCELLQCTVEPPPMVDPVTGTPIAAPCELLDGYLRCYADTLCPELP